MSLTNFSGKYLPSTTAAILAVLLSKPQFLSSKTGGATETATESLKSLSDKLLHKLVVLTSQESTTKDVKLVQF